VATTERACLVIADITGYTSYLAGVELEHAQDILADLMTTVVKALRPPFKLAKLEGDAAFVYQLTDQVDGSILLDVTEGCYFAFRQRLLSILQASTCRCNACTLIPTLDLKLVAHHGSIGVQKMAGRTELIGADVIVVHRLLKNSIEEPAYLFLSEQCLAATTLDPGALGMRRHVENYEHVGEVAGWVHDLEQAFARHREERRIYVGSADADLQFASFFAAPAELVWEYLSSPLLRPLWSDGMTRVDQLDPSGRRQAGTLNHCVHGDGVMVQEFLDWRPPAYFTARTIIPLGFSLLSTHEVEPVAGGAIVRDRFQLPAEPIPAEQIEQLTAHFQDGHESETAKLTELLAAQLAFEDGDTGPALPQVDEAKRLATAKAG